MVIGSHSRRLSSELTLTTKRTSPSHSLALPCPLSLRERCPATQLRRRIAPPVTGEAAQRDPCARPSYGFALGACVVNRGARQ